MVAGAAWNRLRPILEQFNTHSTRFVTAYTSRFEHGCLFLRTLCTDYDLKDSDYNDQETADAWSQGFTAGVQRALIRRYPFVLSPAILSSHSAAIGAGHLQAVPDGE